ncbi:nucleotidyltransferase [Candidatus Daviesbacteria bacterium]|nr:nucleotidyltransferase [Candidatus Daviesbacteria bacterium]
MNQAAKSQADDVYANVLKKLSKTGIHFLVGGTFAYRKYTGIKRETKDMDIFCKAGDFPRLLKALEEEGFKSRMHDSRWIAKAFMYNLYVDIIFATPSGIWYVDDSWFVGAPQVTILGTKVRLIPPEEMIWCRAYIMARDRYDGADINHLILKKGKELDWKRLLNRMEAHWELLLVHFLNFRFVYPSERDLIPKWLMKELLNRLEHQLELPKPKDKTTRGPLLSHNQYNIDVEKWGFKTITLNLP